MVMPMLFCASADLVKKQKSSKKGILIIWEVAFTYLKVTKLMPLNKKNGLLLEG
jgi:hypothetical protein